VIIFLGLTLVVPWLLFATSRLVRWAGHRHGAGVLLSRLVLRLAGRDRARREQLAAVMVGLAEVRTTRRVLTAILSGLAQFGAVGFSLGVVLAFAGSLLLFDVRFYWEATRRPASAAC